MRSFAANCAVVMASVLLIGVESCSQTPSSSESESSGSGKVEPSTPSAPANPTTEAPSAGVASAIATGGAVRRPQDAGAGLPKLTIWDHGL